VPVGDAATKESSDIAMDGWDDGGIERAGVSVEKVASVNAVGLKQFDKTQSF